MKQFEDSAILKWHACDMYKTVLLVEKYPEFIPWYKKTQILSTGHQSMLIITTMQFKKIEKKYTSLVNFSDPERTKEYWITIEANDGPFSSLNSSWHFQQLSEHASIIQFRIQFACSSKFLEIALEPVYKIAQTKILRCFQDRFDKTLSQNPSIDLNGT